MDRSDTRSEPGWLRTLRPFSANLCKQLRELLFEQTLIVYQVGWSAKTPKCCYLFSCLISDLVNWIGLCRQRYHFQTNPMAIPTVSLPYEKCSFIIHSKVSKCCNPVNKSRLQQTPTGHVGAHNKTLFLSRWNSSSTRTDQNQTETSICCCSFFLPFPSSSKPWMDCVSVFFLIAFFSSLFTAAVRRTGHVHRENTWTWQDHWEGLEVETQTRENCLCKKRLRRTRNWIHECARACVCFVHVSSRGKWEGKSERERERYQCQCNGTSQWRGWKEGAHTRDETYWLQLFFCST